MVLMSIILVAPQNASAAKVKLISWNLVNKKKQLNWDGKTSYQKNLILVWESGTNIRRVLLEKNG